MHRLLSMIQRIHSRIPPIPVWPPRVRKLISLLLLFSVLGLVYRSYFRNWVPLGPQRTVETINPKMGVHTRLTDEPDAAKIKRSLEMVREMGAPWIVEYFPWAYYEPRPGQYEWSHPDLVIDHANRQGLTVIARLGFVPEWARPDDSHHLYLPAENYTAFGRFAAEFVRRYQGKVRHLIIWNEPNLSLEWGFRPADPAAYVEMLQGGIPDGESGRSGGAGAGRRAGPHPGSAGQRMEHERSGLSAADVRRRRGRLFRHSGGSRLWLGIRCPTSRPANRSSTSDAPSCCGRLWCATATATKRP